MPFDRLFELWSKAKLESRWFRHQILPDEPILRQRVFLAMSAKTACLNLTYPYVKAASFRPDSSNSSSDITTPFTSDILPPGPRRSLLETETYAGCQLNVWKTNNVYSTDMRIRRHHLVRGDEISHDNASFLQREIIRCSQTSLLHQLHRMK
jgi:hypothetical protein